MKIPSSVKICQSNVSRNTRLFDCRFNVEEYALNGN